MVPKCGRNATLACVTRLTFDDVHRRHSLPKARFAPFEPGPDSRLTPLRRMCTVPGHADDQSHQRDPAGF